MRRIRQRLILILFILAVAVRLGGLAASANAINNLGQIVGSSQDLLYQTSRAQPFISGPDHLLPLVPHIADGGTAYAINGRAQVAGVLSGHAFLFDGVLHDLGTLSPLSYAQSEAHGINDAGTVVGWTASADYFTHAFVYANGRMTDIGTLGGINSYASGINNLGQVVGFSYTNNFGTDHAFLYEQGQLLDLNNLLDPAVAPYWYLAGATAINDAGQIVGSGQGPGGTGGFLLTPVPEPHALFWIALCWIGVYRRRFDFGLTRTASGACPP